MDACQDDITKLNEVVVLPFRQVITYLTYRTSKNNLMEALRKEQEQKSKYNR
jgi:hypothetical protein